MKPIILSYLIFFSSICLGQSTFTYWEKGSRDEVPVGIYEDLNNNLYVSLARYEDHLSDHTRIIKLDELGNLVDSVILINENCKCYIDEIVEGSDSSFLAFGIIDCDSVNNLWVVVIDYNMNVISDFSYPLESQIISNIYSVKTNDANYYTLFTIGSVGNTSIYMYEFSSSGLLLSQENIDEGGQMNIVCDIVNDSNRAQYKIFSYSPITELSCFVSNLNYSLNTINFKFLDGYLLGGNSAKFINSKKYVLSGMYLSMPSNHIDIAAYIIDHKDSVLSRLIIGNSEVNEYLNKDNLSFTNSNNIFLSATTNAIHGNLHFSKSPTEILIYMLDSSLNVKESRLYGGDACYFVYRTFATRDGGLLITSSRYDYLTQNLERDPYILKVDSTGLITSINDPTKNTIKSNEIILYPNPAQSFINIEFPESEESSRMRLIIYSIYGEKQDEINIQHDQSRLIIDVGNYRNGLYIATFLIDQTDIIQQKFIISR